MSKSKILFQLTGSIACYKACEVISQLVRNQFEVKVAASQSALKFIGPATLEGLTGNSISTDLYTTGSMMDHIHLNRWADLIITAPATANYINKIASGIGDDLLGALFLAHDFKKPFLIAPAMNTSMYTNPITQQSLKKLSSLGVQILPTENGSLACGEVGEGRLLSPEMIFTWIKKSLGQENSPRVLITSGGTSEPIDDVRVLTNKSTGKTGGAIADRFIQLGYQVTYLHGMTAALPAGPCHKIIFESFSDLEKLLKSELNNYYDVVIHAAAVSDFSPVRAKGKISSASSFKIDFMTNTKLVDSLKLWSNNKNVKVIAFKLTSTDSKLEQQAAIEKLFQNSQADFIVHNDFTEFKKSEHPYYIHNKKEIVPVSDSSELAHTLARKLQESSL